MMEVQECAGVLRWFLTTLGMSTNQLSIFLRDPERHYPSGALLRAVLAGTRRPTPKLAAYLAVRKAEVERELARGVVIHVDEYRPQPKQVVFAISERPDANPLFTAALTVPPGWLKTCRICQHAFISPWHNQTVCKRPACRETMRQEKKRGRKAAG